MHPTITHIHRVDVKPEQQEDFLFSGYDSHLIWDYEFIIPGNDW